MLRVAVARIPDERDAADRPAPGWLGDGERCRWAALPPPARRAFVAGRALLRDLLRDATGLPREAWEVSALAGMPPVARARDGAVGDGSVHVSLSHRLGWVAAATSDAPVGIDIECLRPARTDAHARAGIMLSRSERPDWDALAPDEREPALLTRWTAKEAWYKCRPNGLAPWDFRCVDAHACAPAQANVRTWAAPPLYLAVCSFDARALAAAACDGLPPQPPSGSFWHVARAASPT